MKKIIVFLALTIFCCSAVFSFTLKDVEKQASQGKYKDAVNTCNEILKQKPGNLNVLRWIAYCNYKAGDFDAVIGMKDQNLKDSQISNFIGLAYMAKKNYAEAEKEFNDAIVYDKKFSEPYQNKAQIYMENKDFVNAKSYFVTASQLNPNDLNLLINLGYVNMQLKDYANAQANFLKAKNISPKNKTVIGNLGNAYLCGKDYVNALKEFETLYALDKNSKEALLGLANTYASVNNYTSAEKYYDMLIKADNTSVNNYNMGIILEKQAKFGKAVPYFAKAVELDGKDTDALNELGWCQFKSANQKDATETINKVFAIDKDNIKSLAYLGVIYDSSENYTKAYENWSRCVILAPKNTDYKINLGKACINTEKYDEAISAYNSALELDKKADNAYLGLGIAKLQKALTNDKSSANLLNEALVIFKTITAKDAKNTVAWTNLGVCYQKNKKYKDAANAYKKALELNPNSSEAKANLNEISSFLK